MLQAQNFMSSNLTLQHFFLSLQIPMPWIQRSLTDATSFSVSCNVERGCWWYRLQYVVILLLPKKTHNVIFGSHRSIWKLMINSPKILRVENEKMSTSNSHKYSSENDPLLMIQDFDILIVKCSYWDLTIFKAACNWKDKTSNNMVVHESIWCTNAHTWV